jgi:Ser/Thr protein kinase RdoA (MazF antagonist)
MHELKGGREGVIFKRNDTVVRPLNSWSPSIHLLLTHLQESGFDVAPRFLGVNGGNEILSFVTGGTYNYPLVGAIGSECALKSAGQLLRKLHDHSQGFIDKYDVNKFTWMLPTREPAEVICHGDFTPYNVSLNQNRVTGVFDFDTSHPGPRIWDLAFSAYCWAPLKANQEGQLADLSVQVKRTKIFCDAYGASKEQRSQLVATVVTRLRTLVDFMISKADEGDSKFQQDINDGHHLEYQKDIDYLQVHKAEVTKGVC